MMRSNHRVVMASPPAGRNTAGAGATAAVATTAEAPAASLNRLSATSVCATDAKPLLTNAKLLVTNAATASHMAKHYSAVAYILALPGADKECGFEGTTALIDFFRFSFVLRAVAPRAARKGLR